MRKPFRRADAGNYETRKQHDVTTGIEPGAASRPTIMK